MSHISSINSIIGHKIVYQPGLVFATKTGQLSLNHSTPGQLVNSGYDKIIEECKSQVVAMLTEKARLNGCNGYSSRCRGGIDFEMRPVKPTNQFNIEIEFNGIENPRFD